MTYKVWVKYGNSESVKVIFDKEDVNDLKKEIKDELQITSSTNWITLRKRKHGEDVDLDPGLKVDESFVNDSKTPIQVFVKLPDDETDAILDEEEVRKEVRKEDWQWPCLEEEEQDYHVSKRMRKSTQHDSVPFRIINVISDYEPTTVFVELTSQPLINFVQEILPENNALLDDTSRIKAQDLYHIMEIIAKKRDDLRSASKPTSESAEKVSDEQIHLNHLTRFLEQEYEQTTKIRKRMYESKTVSFDMLWVFYTANLDVWYRCEMSGQQLGGIISSVQEEYEYNNRGKISKMSMFIINIKIVDHDSHGFKHCNVTRMIKYFKGEMNFSDLPVVPFSLTKSQDFLKDTIAKNGRRFFELAEGSHYMNYEGNLFSLNSAFGFSQVEKIRANGRVMIDLKSFAIMKPNYPMGNARPPNTCDIELNGEMSYLKDKEDQRANYHLAPALVYGFSFALKEWGQFMVLNFSEICFDTEAFDHLVMPLDKKEILEGLVRQYGHQINDNDNITSLSKPLDPISNKGKGCIFLCYGPPGTGKTLSAESVAEFLKRPLWMISIHELGMNPSELELQLIKVLDVAFRWKAVLLLDEADIYLEKRSTVDLNRNAMTGIFLRQLEYYQGILFLTTNRVVAFDDAFCSRINMFIHYSKLNLGERREVWSNFIKRSNLSLNADDFAGHDLNGREIRNVLHTAQMLSKSKDENITTEHVNNVIKIVQGFQKDMKSFDKVYHDLHEEIRKNRGQTDDMNELNGQIINLY